MSPEKPAPRLRRNKLEHEEEKAWVGFYKRVGNDPALATEVLTQLDSDPEMKRSHLALYLCCRESLRTHKARQARNQRIGQFVRTLCAGLAARLLVQWPQALRQSLRRGGDIAVECLPETGKEPAKARARQLIQEPAFAKAQAEFRQQELAAENGESATPASSTTARRAV
jgi:hypothetical protein